MAEAVKGLFRRQAQKFKEKDKKSELATIDDDFEEKKKALAQTEKACKNLSAHVRQYVTHINGASAALGDIAADLAALAPSSASSTVPGIFRLTAESLSEETPVIARVSERNVVTPLDNLLAGYKDLSVDYEKRHAARLEMDFFRRKVAQLETTQHEEKDKTRLPRNTAILEKWKSSYTELHAKALATADDMLEQRENTFGMVCAQLRWLMAWYAHKAAVGFTPLYDGAPPPSVPPAEGTMEAGARALGGSSTKVDPPAPPAVGAEGSGVGGGGGGVSLTSGAGATASPPSSPKASTVAAGGGGGAGSPPAGDSAAALALAASSPGGDGDFLS